MLVINGLKFISVALRIIKAQVFFAIATVFSAGRKNIVYNIYHALFIKEPRKLSGLSAGLLIKRETNSSEPKKGFHCTQPFIIVRTSSLYDRTTVEKDVNSQVIDPPSLIISYLPFKIAVQSFRIDKRPETFRLHQVKKMS